MALKIGLVDVDSHNFPNLCLMKLSSYHKALGGAVDWWKSDDYYDVVYASKVFSESKLPEITNADQVIIGGSGIDLNNKLPYEVEHSMPDYTLYPQYDFALGFLTRGCPRLTHAQSHGGFCITPDKDGCVPRKVANLDEFWAGQKKVVLLDQNLLACKDRMELIQQLSDSKATFEFNGGMDARYMSDEVINAFRSVKVKDFHFAWDDPRENMLPHFERIVKSGIKAPGQIGVYVLTNFWSTTEEDLFRVYELRKLGLMPYVMVYDKQKFVDKHGRWLPGVFDKYSEEQLIHFKTCQHMQRWTCFRRFIKSIPDFNDYEPYKKWRENGFRIR